MRKIIILSCVLIIAIAAMAIKYFSALASNNSNIEKALRNIPQDAAIILNFNNDNSFYEIFKDYELFDAVVGEQRAEEISLLQQALLKQPDLTEATDDKNIFISFHPNKADSVDFLYSMNLNEGLEPEEIEETLLKNPSLSAKKEGSEGIYTIAVKSLPRPFYVYFGKGSAMGSFSRELLASSIDKSRPKIDEAFLEEINHTSKQNQNSPVNIFINHNRIPNFLSNYIKGKTNGWLGLLTNIKGVSSLNMNFKSDALMFNGISRTDTSAPSYVNLYLSQKPVKNDLKKILPENTAYFISFGISDYQKFENGLHHFFSRRKELPRMKHEMELIKEESGVDLDKELKPYWSDEFAIMETSGREKIGILKVKNGRQVDFILHLISTPATAVTSRLNHSNIFYYYFGDPLKIYSRPYVAVIDNYVILANSSSSVQNFISNYQNEKLLIKTPEFINYNQYVANQSNVFYFINNQNADRQMSTNLRPKYAEAFRSEHYGLKDFYGLSYQWSSDDGHFFTNIYIDYKLTGTQKLKEAWQADIGSKPVTRPQVVDFKGQPLILVQNQSNTIYALSESGAIVWSLPLEGKITGSFHLLSDNEAIFNTTNKLYKIDLAGKVAQGFPIKLPFNSSYDLTLSKDKLFIPCGNVIVGFDKNGIPLTNWSHELNGKILYDIKAAFAGDQEYIIAATEKGGFYFYNEIGDLVGKAEHAGDVYKNPVFLENDAVTPGLNVITTDTAANLAFISMKGGIRKKKLVDLHDSNHSFFYGNLLGDDKPELILLDRKNLTVLSSDGTPAWDYSFNSLSSRKLNVIRTNNYTWQCSVFDAETKEIYIFNDEGNTLKGFPVKGNNLFQIISLSSGKRVLIDYKDDLLRAYKL